jgi:hypothetical protein
LLETGGVAVGEDVKLLCIARVQLPAVNLGETNFEDGFGSPGLFVQEFPESYVAGELRDGEGKRIPSQSRLIVYSTTTHVAFIRVRSAFSEAGWQERFSSHWSVSRCRSQVALRQEYAVSAT